MPRRSSLASNKARLDELLRAGGQNAPIEAVIKEHVKPKPTAQSIGAGTQRMGAMRPASMEDISLDVGERGMILGMTRVGKSTLAERLIDTWTQRYARSRTVVLDSKPRFRAQWQLNGLPAAPLYRNWDWGYTIPGSVVIPLRDPKAELALAWSLGYRIVIAQIHRRSDIKKLDDTLQAAYEGRKKNYPLFFYVDELNNFFRSGQAAGNGIVMAITSGGERSTAFLGAAQRPRWISVESIESMTKLYWFYTPYGEDVKHLKSMGVPSTARPPVQYYVFYFFDRLSMKQGMCKILPMQVKK
jgi:hypothetical protein